LGGSEVVLVVDDDDSVRALVSRILAKQGYSVVAASDGVEAISVLRQRPDIRLVLTDVAMPRMNGARLAEYLRAKSQNVSVLLMTGCANELSSGLKDSSTSADTPVLMKPFTESELARAVRQAIDLKDKGSKLTRSLIPDA
jgi:CheY-like chemotaxis protein